MLPIIDIIVHGTIQGNCVMTISKPIKLRIVATVLFRKWTPIGIRILSVFRYSMHMQIPKTNALIIPPNSCPIAKIPEDNNIAGIIPILIFNLLNKTPLNTNSSRTGAIMIEDTISKSREDGSNTSGSKSGAGIFSG